MAKRAKNFILNIIWVFAVFGSAIAQAGRVEDRARFVESTSQSDLENLTFRYKMISSRAYGLYLESLLPEKGNPYQHMLNAFNAYNLNSFKAAQRSSGAFMKARDWLPYASGEDITATALNSDPEKKAAVIYLARWAASSRVLDFVLEKYSQDVLIGPMSKFLEGPAARKFATARKAHNFLQNRVQSLLGSQRALRKFLITEERVAYLLLANQFAEAMRPHLQLVANKANSQALRHFFGEVQRIAQNVSRNPKIFGKHLSDLKAKVGRLMTRKSSRYRHVELALNSVDLPESSEIDGSENSFEAVFRLETGFDMIVAIYSGVAQWN